MPALFELSGSYGQKDMFSVQLHISEAAVCLKPCKNFGPDRTKMFHVKHFGKIGAFPRGRGIQGAVSKDEVTD
jgi:hypothetical protein